MNDIHGQSAEPASCSAPLHKAINLGPYLRADNGRALAQSLATLLPLVALWWLVAQADGALWLQLLLALPLGLFTLRVLVLMHECGHGSLFRSQRLNRAFGFLFGVLSGMPQYVWSQHHNYHHAHNGDWDLYRGPLTTCTVAEYEALGEAGQRRYRRLRSPWLAPLGGFGYLLFYPRFNWLRGTALLLWHQLRHKLAQPGVPWREHAATFRGGRWQSRREYWHMTWNNIVLLALWGLMCALIGPAAFFPAYMTSIALAGGAGIALFTVQHNFEHAYASATEGWDVREGALRGTSYLVLPAWLNWFTANIGYHHVHHLSSKIPNYRLADCHHAHAEQFAHVTRLRLAQVGRALTCLLWDREAGRIISFAEYHRRQPAPY